MAGNDDNKNDAAVREAKQNESGQGNTRGSAPVPASTNLLKASTLTSDSVNLREVKHLAQEFCDSIASNDIQKFRQALGYITNPNSAAMSLKEVTPRSTYESNLPAPYKDLIEVAGPGMNATGRDLADLHKNGGHTARFDTVFGEFIYKNSSEIVSILGGYEVEGTAQAITLQDFNRAVAMASACHSYGPSSISTMERFGDWANFNAYEGLRISNASTVQTEFLPRKFPPIMRKDLVTFIDRDSACFILKVRVHTGTPNKAARVLNVLTSLFQRKNAQDLPPSKRMICGMIWEYLVVINKPSSTLQGYGGYEFDDNSVTFNISSPYNLSNDLNGGPGSFGRPYGGNDGDDDSPNNKKRKLENGVITTGGSSGSMSMS